MEIITQAELLEFIRLDADVDTLTLNMLVASAIDVIEHKTDTKLRPYVEEGVTVTPVVPVSVKHAIALFVSAHFDNRSGADESAMRAIDHLCARIRKVPM